MKRMICLAVGGLMVLSVTYAQAQLKTSEVPDKAELTKDIRECAGTAAAAVDIDKIKLAVVFCCLGYKAMDLKLYQQAADYFKRSLYLAPGYAKSVKGLNRAGRMPAFDNCAITMNKLDQANLSWE